MYVASFCMKKNELLSCTLIILLPPQQFNRYVDPAMASLVSELLVYRPENVPLAMLEHFKWKQEGCPPEKNDTNRMAQLRKAADRSDR